MPQLTYDLVPPVGVHGMIASYMEAEIIVPRLAQGLVPVGYLAAPGTDSMVGPPLATVSSQSTNPGQVKALPAGLVADPISGTAWVGIPLYDSTRQPYDSTLGYSAYQDQTTVPVLMRGAVYVTVESGTLNAQGDVYVRVAPSGSNTILGSVAPAAGTGLVLWSSARFLSGRMTNNLAVMYVRF